MRFNSRLISCFLLASAVLAGFDLTQQLNLLERSDYSDSSVSAGASWSKDKGTFDYIVGVLTAPELSGGRGSAVASWIGIDDDGGCAHTFVSGILSTVTSDGTQHQAYMRWYPHPPVDYPFNITTGDRVQVMLTVIDWNSASLTFENLSTGQLDTKEFQCTALLCGMYAEWMVGYVAVNGQTVPFANFSSVTIGGVIAGTSGGNSYGLDGASLYQLTTDHGVVAKPVVDNDTLSIDM